MRRNRSIWLAAFACLLLAGCNSSGGGSAGQILTSSAPTLHSVSWYKQFLRQSSVAWPTSGVVSIQAVSGAGSDQVDVPITFGQVFVQGAVASGQSLVANVNGQTVPTQVDEKATWPDGSLRHAIVSVQLPDLAAGSSPFVTLDTIAAEPQSQASVTIQDLLATTFNATVSLNVGGTVYKANARSLLQAASQAGSCHPWGKVCNLWLSGPLVSEWLVGGPVADSSGAVNPHLSVYFYVRAYKDPNMGQVTRARVDTVIENDWTYVQNPQDITYNATITVGQQSYQVSNLDHYSHTRWHKVLWWGNEPNVYAKLNGNYIQASGAISRYADVHPTDTFLNSLTTSFSPMTNGDQTKNMGATGAQAAIGPLPQWTTTYVISTDPRAFGWMLANDDAVGSYPFHYRDEATGRPLEITNHPYVTIADYSYAKQAAASGNSNYAKDLLPACGGDCSDPFSFDIAHHPSIGYVPYMVTGDFYYLEELQFAASYIELWANPAYRQYSKGVLYHAQPQVRGQAWALRTLSDAAFITPDSDPMKSYFIQLMTNVLSDYNTQFTDGGLTDPLHIAFGEFPYTINGQARDGIAPWQDDFFTWAVGHAAEQGFPGAAKLLDWKAAFQVGMMEGWRSDPTHGYCWLEASAYNLQVRDSQGAPLYSSLTKIYQTTFPNLYGLTCNSQAMVNAMSSSSHTYQPGEMVGYADSPTGYPSNLQIGLAMAAESGIPGAADAWQIFSTRSVKPDYSNYPNFDVIPRRKKGKSNN